MDVVQHQILSLDFWQNTVSYEGKTFPSGTIGCDALNISPDLIEQITELCGSLNLFMGQVKMSVETITGTTLRSSGMVSKRKLFKKPLIHSTIGNRLCWKSAMLSVCDVVG